MNKRTNDIIKEVSNRKWTLLCDNYINMDTIMGFKCPEGHEVELTLKQWRKLKTCPICEHNGSIKSKTKDKKRIIALDNATNITGWAVYDNEKLVGYGKYNTSGSDSSEKIYDMANWLINIINTWEADTIVFEDIQQQNNVNTFKTLAKLQGVLEYIAKSYHMEYYIISPATWKSFNGVRGKTRKEQKKNAQLRVLDKFDINATEDECDAILLGNYAINKYIKNNRMVNFES